MKKFYMRSNLGNVLKLDNRKTSIFGYRVSKMKKFTNPKKSGKETKYLRLLKFIHTHPGVTYTEIVKNICSCTPVKLWDGKVVPNNDMISETLTGLREFGLIESTRKDGYHTTKMGGDYILYTLYPDFKRFKSYKKFQLGPWVISIHEPRLVQDKDEIIVVDGKDKDAFPLTTLNEFIDFIKENNYKIQIVEND